MDMIGKREYKLHLTNIVWFKIKTEGPSSSTVQV
jgi:hypothetical protein